MLLLDSDRVVDIERRETLDIQTVRVYMLI